jgi:hypothetical protein
MSGRRSPVLQSEVTGILGEDTGYAIVVILINHNELEIAKRLITKRLHQRMELLSSSKRRE